MLHDGTAALCTRPDLSRVQASPTNGCAFWEREPGSDDEPDWVPAGVVVPVRPPVSPRQAAAGPAVAGLVAEADYDGNLGLARCSLR
jgi:hypothetical protein